MPAARNEVATPEDRELDVPGAHEVVGQPAGEVEPEEAAEIGAVVLTGGADERLDQEQHRHHEEEPGAGSLCRGKGDISGRAERERRLLAALPAEEVPAAEGPEQQPDPAEQRDQRDDAPHDHVRGGPVVDQRLRGPVVGVGVVLARPQGRAGPRRPGEERGELPDLGLVGDRVRAQALVGRRVAEVVGVVADHLLKGRRLRGACR